MQISLAPMEGVIDFPMRRLLTDLGGYDRCVTEFVRVTDVLLPERVFFRLCPELKEGSVRAMVRLCSYNCLVDRQSRWPKTLFER